MLPKERNIAPRYDQKVFDAAHRQNRFQCVVSPQASTDLVWINQDAWLSLADVHAGQQVDYSKENSTNGVYFFLIEGGATIDGHVMNKRDGLGLTGGELLSVKARTNVQLLAIEVPLLN